MNWTPLRKTISNGKLDTLAPVITSIVNISLADSSVPSTSKKGSCATITKETKFRKNYQNYRRVSNLQYVSKLSRELTQDLDLISFYTPSMTLRSQYIASAIQLYQD